jgi:hypothetical protein
LKPVQNRVATVIVDGYVWLGPGNRPGLGAHLYKALYEKIPVIGVAKSIYSGATSARPVLRGRSRRPLYVTAAGMDSLVAAEHVRTMHGPHRIPALLKRADELCRSPERPSTEGEQQMSAQNQNGKNSLSPKTLALLHRYLDDFVVVGKARKGELSSVELGALLREAVVDAEEIRQIVSEYKRFREG